jgi:hypothetical protein
MARNEYTFDQLPQEKRREIARNGAKASNKAKKEKKEQLKQRKSIVETLKDVLYTNVKNKALLKRLSDNGIEGEQNYLVAMISAAILKNVAKGNLADVLKLIEVLEGSATEKIEITNMDKTVLELETYLAKKRKNNEQTN